MNSPLVLRICSVSALVYFFGNWHVLLQTKKFNKMSDSSSDSEVECISSQPESHDVVPSSILYQLKFIGGGSRSGKTLQYMLKEGKSLPYSTQSITKKGKGWKIFLRTNKNTTF